MTQSNWPVEATLLEGARKAILDTKNITKKIPFYAQATIPCLELIQGISPEQRNAA